VLSALEEMMQERRVAVDHSACSLASVEFLHKLKKGQMMGEEGAAGLTPAERFDALTA